jgi:kojibiose phosphorylase
MVLAPDGEVIRILTGEQQQHISADVAFAVWSYWEATGDERFLIGAGAAILIETARFWASRVMREDDGRYHIRGVIGPDEYHETVDDNAYTNGIAQWNLETAEKVTKLLARRWPAQWQALSCRVGLRDEEPTRWLRIARDLYTGFDERTGLFEQFQGYFGLEKIDLAAFQPRRAPMDVLLGRERTQRSKVIKQPDVVMLIYLLWDRFPADVRRIKFRILRAPLRPRQLAEPGHSRSCSGAPGKDCARRALFPPGRRDRPGQQETIEHAFPRRGVQRRAEPKTSMTTTR